MKTIYLDNAATTQPDPEVVEEIKKAIEFNWGNPSSVHKPGKEARALIEKSRKTIAELLLCHPQEIYFTSGATEAINTILQSCVINQNISRIITSKLEHNASLNTIQHLEKHYTLKVDYVDFQPDGTPSLIDLEKQLRAERGKTLVSLMHGNNETGSLSPIEEIARICKQHGALYLSDTVQTIGKYPVSPSLFGIDFMVCAGHKLHGPKGIGFMYIRKGLIIPPLLFGGGQERNMRSGTENTPGVAGLVKALSISIENLPENAQRMSQLKNFLVSQLKAEIPEMHYFSQSDSSGLMHILSAGIRKNAENALIHIRLDMKGICISAGSACSSGDLNVPHALKEMGIDDSWVPLRISISRFTTEEEIRYFVSSLKELL